MAQNLKSEKSKEDFGKIIEAPITYTNPNIP
jgi:hypothetical protein